MKIFICIFKLYTIWLKNKQITNNKCGLEVLPVPTQIKSTLAAQVAGFGSTGKPNINIKMDNSKRNYLIL